MQSFKLFFCAATLFISGCILAQEPTYEAVLQQEIVSNLLENTKSAQEAPYVIMVSIDGFRYDYAKKYGAKNLLEMAVNGASATRMIPSFPSKTFPNHYTLATGLYPQNHGIVANSFYDASLKKSYRIANRAAVEDGSWYGGVPLWNLAQLQGMLAASYFWVGSEANVNGLHPKYYYKFNKKTPYSYRVKRILEWLQLPPKERPHMITLYFAMVDDAGHKYGPDAPETKAAVLYVDQQIGALRKGIADLGLPVNLIVTADHGMVGINKTINVADYAPVDRNRFLGGPVAMIYTQSQAETDTLYHKLSKASLFKTYKRDQVPNYLHFKDSPRVGDLVLVADAPYTIGYAQLMGKELKVIKGMHGYDPFDHKEMGAIFYAEGPNIKKGQRIPAFENVHVYPLVAQLLGLKLLMPIDGSAAVLGHIVKD